MNAATILGHHLDSYELDVRVDVAKRVAFAVDRVTGTEHPLDLRTVRADAKGFLDRLLTAVGADRRLHAERAESLANEQEHRRQYHDRLWRRVRPLPLILHNGRARP